ncbi:MAG TPA: hypothetical protein VN618_10065 [Solirubrobacteraceae bacterium]|nr:hypothetical protein [Solirubrobacteraceae bacterium]
MIRVPAAGVLALACLALAGCQTTQEKSAALERAAKSKAVARNATGLRIATVSPTIKAVTATALHSSEGAAVAVELVNSSGAAREVPLLVSVAEGSRAGAYTNSAPGLARSLTSLSYVPAHGRAVWVDDQVQLAGTPGRATAKVGTAKPVGGAPPAIAILSHKLEAEPGGGQTVTGTVANRSQVDQHELVIYALAKKNRRVVAAGRSVLALLGAGATGRFQIFLLGASASGAQLELSAPPSSFG